jgi:Putative carbonic anhydrase
MSNMKFATAINCIDGRVQIPVIEWLRKGYGVDYVDVITEPGPDKILAEDKDSPVLESIKRRVEISVNKHASELIAIVGHYDCAGNPVENDMQLKQIQSAIKTVESWDFEVQIIGLWVDENWEVCMVE